MAVVFLNLILEKHLRSIGHKMLCTSTKTTDLKKKKSLRMQLQMYLPSCRRETLNTKKKKRINTYNADLK